MEMEELKLSGPPLEVEPPPEAYPEPPPPLPLTGSEPLPIRTAAHTFDVQFHPRDPIVVTCNVEGDVELHSFDRDLGTTEPLRSLRCHTDSCRTARFLPDGGAAGGSSSSQAGATSARLATAAADRLAAVTDLETGKKLWKARMTGAGNVVLPMGGELFAVGDDDGGLRIFDTRQKKATVRWQESEDYISDLAFREDTGAICATSGEGTLAVYDVRKAGTKGLIAMSDFQEDELLSCCIMKGGKRVVCGSQSGVLAVFFWGDFGDQKDRIKGHPLSVDTMVKLDEETLLTGSSDGKVRVVGVYHHERNNSVVGIAADHGDYPLERLALSPCGGLFASVSHIQPAVKLWSMEVVEQILAGEVPGDAQDAAADAAADVDSDDSDEPPPPKRPKKTKKGKGVQRKNETQRLATGFFNKL